MAEAEARQRETGWAVGGAAITSALIVGALAWASVWTTSRTNQAQQAAPQEQVAGQRQETPAAPGVVPGVPRPQPSSLAALAVDPTAHVGREVEVTGTVAERISDRGFWLEDEGRRMLVRTDVPRADLSEGQRVQVVGVVWNSQDFARSEAGRATVGTAPDALREAVTAEPVHIVASRIDLVEPSLGPKATASSAGGP